MNKHLNYKCKDQMLLKNIQAFCRLGVDRDERARGQSVRVDLALEMDLNKACKSDNIKDTISYVEISKTVQEIAKIKEYFLIEHLCEEISSGLLEKFMEILSVDITIHKPIINAEGFSGDASIRIHRNQK